ncbi:MAG: 2-oxo acid dehydrogenase subunit E2 [Planctomycetes bacterium]|nr:2-oxo acid dehydrogenase subunit E2 [Planctomycetota bacterium]
MSSHKPPSRKRGQRFKLKSSRRFMVDYLYFCKKVPSQPISRDCNVTGLVELRKKGTRRFGWASIMLKAIAHLADREPELRYSYMKWPWGHLYLHPHQVGYVAVSRDDVEEDILIFHRIEKPESSSLLEIQDSIHEAQTQSLEKNRLFQARLKFCRLPWFFRRMIWWFALSLSGNTRTSMTGTVGVTSVAACGANSIHPPTLGNLVITYGPVQDDGAVRITFVYDHRVLDGLTVAKYLEQFESILNEVVAEELQALSESSLAPKGQYSRVSVSYNRQHEQSTSPQKNNFKHRQTKME